MTAWDISTASYSQTVAAVGTGNVVSIFISSDGTKALLCNTDENVYTLSLSTPWDISTASTDGTTSIASQEGNPNGFWVSSDGTKAAVCGTASDGMEYYTMSTAWDFTTRTVAGSTNTISNPRGCFMKDDGTKMYQCSDGDDAVSEWTLSTPFDVTSKGSASSISVSTYSVNPHDLAFSSDGTQFYVTSTQYIVQYTMSTAWDVTTATYTRTLDLGDYSTDIRGLTFNKSGVMMYACANNEIYDFNLPLSTITTGNTAYWKFDGDATDSIGSNDADTVSGVTNSTSYGIINEGYDFPGTVGNTVEWNNNSVFDISSGDFSISLWINLDSTASFQPILQNQNSSGQATGWEIDFYLGEIRFLEDGGSLILGSSTSPTAGDYCHYIVTSDGSHYRAFINGVLAATTTVTNYPNFANGIINLGTRNKTNGAYQSSLSGNLDEFSLWNRTLSESEITSLYNSGDGFQYPYEEEPATGWTGTINGVTDPSKINGVAVADITSVNGV